MVNRHVFRHGETIVGLDSIDLADVADVGSTECVENGLSHMGKYKGGVPTSLDLIPIAQSGITVAPTLDFGVRAV